MNFWAVSSGKLRYPRATCTPPIQSSPATPGAICDGLPRPQALAACVAARLCGAVGVDDLAPGPSPRLHKRAGEGFASRNDVAAQRIGKVQFGGWSEGGEQHRR